MRTKVLSVLPLVPLFLPPLGFNVRVGSLIHTWWRHTCYIFPKIHLLCDTRQPFGSSQADLFHIQVTRYYRLSYAGSAVLKAYLNFTALEK